MLLYAASSVVLPGIRKPDAELKEKVMQFGRFAETDKRLHFLAIDYASQSLAGIDPKQIEESPVLQMMSMEFPWKRDVYAFIVERLINAGARAVVIDLRYPLPREGDERFGEVLERFRDNVVIGCNFPESDRLTGISTSMEMPAESLIPPGNLEDDRVGFVTVWPDIDGVVRRAYFRRTLMEAMNLPPVPDQPSFESIAARGIRKAGLAHLIPGDSQPRMFRFADDGKRGTLEPRSVYEIFTQRAWEGTFRSGAFFKDKIVVVGPEGNWTKDVVTTPFGLMAGALFHLNVMNAILKNEFVSEVPMKVEPPLPAW